MRTSMHPKLRLLISITEIGIANRLAQKIILIDIKSNSKNMLKHFIFILTFFVRGTYLFNALTNFHHVLKD